MFPFEPFKDNKPWRRLLSIAFGLAFIVWALVGVGTGHITATNQNITFYVARGPVVFWLVVSIIIVLGIAFIYRGIRGRPLHTMTGTEAKVVSAWHQAAADLGIQFTSPFIVTLSDGRVVESLGFIHHFGRRVGTSISVLGEPSARKVRLKADDDYFTSILGNGYTRYVRDDFIKTLNDWGYFGPVASRPAWYSPAGHRGADGPRRV